LELDSSLQRTFDRLKIEGPLPENYDLVEHIRTRQIPFSQKTFGPGTRTNGVLDHIQKEIEEVREAPDDVEEWIDIAMLSLDGAWRCLQERIPESEIPKIIAAVIAGKQSKNEKRDWPDWKTQDRDKAICHDRSGEIPD